MNYKSSSFTETFTILWNQTAKLKCPRWLLNSQWLLNIVERSAILRDTRFRQAWYNNSHDTTRIPERKRYEISRESRALGTQERFWIVGNPIAVVRVEINVAPRRYVGIISCFDTNENGEPSSDVQRRRHVRNSLANVQFMAFLSLSVYTNRGWNCSRYVTTAVRLQLDTLGQTSKLSFIHHRATVSTVPRLWVSRRGFF